MYCYSNINQHHCILYITYIRWFVRLRNNELYRITYILCIWNLPSFGGKIRQNNHANSSGKFKTAENPPIGFSQFVAVCSRDRKPTHPLNIARIRLFSYSICSFVVYSMDVTRSFSVFCSYKLEFYHERLSVSQKARIKF